MRQNNWRDNQQKKAEIERRQRLQIRLDKIALAGFGPAYTLSQPNAPTTPLVLSSPHSGRDYPPSFLAQSLLSLKQLRQSEDCYVDHIIKPLTEFGIPLITAKFPRIYLDLNRSPDEWPPDVLGACKTGSFPITARARAYPLTTARARAGLGVVPTRVGPDTDIYPHDITGELIQGRLDALYYPYHQALQNLVTSAKQNFGHALLLDCHSMPGHGAAGQARPDIVLGNCHGESCYPETIEFIEAAFTSLGYKVMCNHPYAGGFITSHYGRPSDKIEAVQIEINKDVYLNADKLEPHIGMAKLTENMQIVILKIKNYLSAATARAAE